MLAIILYLIGIIILFAVIYCFLRPTVRGAIYFPTTERNVKLMLKLAELKPGEHIADIGSGDGRIVLACAARGIYAVGYEINPLLVYFSRRAIYRAGLEKYATVHWKSFWRADFSQYDAVFVYGIPYIMERIARKLELELKPGAKIVSNMFKFPDWQQERSEKDEVRLYILK